MSLSKTERERAPPSHKKEKVHITRDERKNSERTFIPLTFYFVDF